MSFSQATFTLIFLLITSSAQGAPKEDARAPVDVPLEPPSRMGIKLTAAEKKPIAYTIRTVGSVTADQTKEAHVHTKINGWIEVIYADYITGVRLKS